MKISGKPKEIAAFVEEIQKRREVDVTELMKKIEREIQAEVLVRLYPPKINCGTGPDPTSAVDIPQKPRHIL